MRAGPFLALAPFALAACQAGGPVTVPGELIESVGLFARDGVVADIYAERCAAQGVRLIDPDGEELPGKFAAEMIIQGYMPDQIEAALRQKNAQTIAAQARAYIAEQGLSVEGDPAALCAGARKEATRSSGPGRFLTAG